MSALTPFDPREALGDGRTVVEASAGTGKTFTISALVTRLIAGEGVPLDEILVVTFTRAATAELRSRVRKRLVTTLRALEGGPADPGDRNLSALLAGDWEPAASRIREALTHFDRAQIFTIHGFAQRLLGHLGLRARLSHELEPGEPDELLLAQTAGDLIVGRFAANGDEEPLESGAVIEIGRTVVGTPDARIVPDAAEVAGRARARVELAHAMRDEVARRMRAAGLVTYDDGLVEVRNTLADAEVGAAALELLARRYAVALVDESQDTDPIQWQVIRAVFDETHSDGVHRGAPRLVVIGDPKQSIYSFRGADVESYLAALDGADALRTLETNWRSDGPLIDGLDVLFAGATFGDDRIEYHRVRPAPDHTDARIHGAGAPLVIRRFGPDLELPTRRDGFYLIDPARRTVAADVAAEIVRLLDGGVEVDTPEGREPLRPDQLAVLCRTRRQVDMVRSELDLRGVPSVAARTGGVFASVAAEEWRRFLHGVEAPERMDRARLAAGSLLMGYSPQQLAALPDDAALELQRLLQEWRETLYEDGVPALLAAASQGTDLPARVLAMSSGERIMTDLTHIAEEMHTVWRRRRIGSLVGWLETTMAEAAQRDDANIEEPEARQRRLETDADAVQVQTIHGAKGLQWPVVFVPYLWDVSTWKQPVPTFHGDRGMPRERLIDVGGRDAPGFANHQEAAAAEDAAEEGRLLYVALTRAEHQLVVWWVENSANTGISKLNDLLTKDGRTADDVVAAGRGSIAMELLDESPPLVEYRPDDSESQPLERARFERRLDYDWRRASFSSLSPEHPIGAAAETTEQPHRDDESDLAVEPDEAMSGGDSALPMANLPRGARFGTLVHQVFEHVPFDAPDLEAAIRDALATELRYATWDFDPEALIAGLVASMETPLGPSPDDARLRDLDPRRVFDELVFELPVRTDAGPVSLRDIGTVMLEHLPAFDPYRAYAETLRDLPGARFRGYLTGAIDLTAVVPWSDGDRYVVMDYKSNALPTRGEVAGPHDYGPGPLRAAMIDGNYVLQATLYQVALHRYLQWRLRGYDPQQHLGGVMYLFVRGMAGSDAPVVDGERCGVVRWQPPVAMITGLSELFVGGTP